LGFLTTMKILAGKKTVAGWILEGKAGKRATGSEDAALLPQRVGIGGQHFS
jgi:hypothetical protein